MAQVFGLAGALGSAETAMAKENKVERSEPIKEATTHRDVVGPTATFETARNKTIELINHGMTDPGSFGEQKGRGWSAVLEGGENGEPQIVKITVKAGGKETVQRFALTSAEVTDAKGNITDAYSFETDVEGAVKDVDDARIEKEARDVVAKAIPKNGPKGGDHIAMEDGE